MDLVKGVVGFVKRVCGHVFVRPFQRYNVEERAFKLLDRMEKSDGPVVKAPKHKPTKAYLEQLIKGETSSLFPSASLSLSSRDDDLT